MGWAPWINGRSLRLLLNIDPNGGWMSVGKTVFIPTPWLIQYAASHPQACQVVENQITDMNIIKMYMGDDEREQSEMISENTAYIQNRQSKKRIKSMIF